MPSSPAIARISWMLRGDLDSTPDTSCFTSPREMRVSKKRMMNMRCICDDSTIHLAEKQSQHVPEKLLTYQLTEVSTYGLPMVPDAVHL